MWWCIVLGTIPLHSNDFMCGACGVWNDSTDERTTMVRLCMKMERLCQLWIDSTIVWNDSSTMYYLFIHNFFNNFIHSIKF